MVTSTANKLKSARIAITGDDIKLRIKSSAIHLTAISHDHSNSIVRRLDSVNLGPNIIISKRIISTSTLDNTVQRLIGINGPNNGSIQLNITDRHVITQRISLP